MQVSEMIVFKTGDKVIFAAKHLFDAHNDIYKVKGSVKKVFGLTKVMVIFNNGIERDIDTQDLELC